MLGAEVPPQSCLQVPKRESTSDLKSSSEGPDWYTQMTPAIALIQRDFVKTSDANECGEKKDRQALRANHKLHVPVGLTQLLPSVFVQQAVYFSPQVLLVLLVSFKQEESDWGDAEGIGEGEY
jgi:hypothetical protein